jgi:hypothetical protein
MDFSTGSEIWKTATGATYSDRSTVGWRRISGLRILERLLRGSAWRKLILEGGQPYPI